MKRRAAAHWEKTGEKNRPPVLLIGKGRSARLFGMLGEEASMDNGASNYRRFLQGDENSSVEIIKDYVGFQYQYGSAVQQGYHSHNKGENDL